MDEGGTRYARGKERRKRRREEEEEAVEKEREIRAEGWANRANGQVAYLWRPYFRYMNWFPSKVRDAARLSSSKCIERCPAVRLQRRRFATRGHLALARARGAIARA